VWFTKRAFDVRFLKLLPGLCISVYCNQTKASEQDRSLGQCQTKQQTTIKGSKFIIDFHSILKTKTPPIFPHVAVHRFEIPPGFASNNPHHLQGHVGWVKIPVFAIIGVHGFRRHCFAVIFQQPIGWVEWRFRFALVVDQVVYVVSVCF